jgi:hypothetical protein
LVIIFNLARRKKLLESFTKLRVFKVFKLRKDKFERNNSIEIKSER